MMQASQSSGLQYSEILPEYYYASKVKDYARTLMPSPDFSRCSCACLRFSAKREYTSQSDVRGRPFTRDRLFIPCSPKHSFETPLCLALTGQDKQALESLGVTST